MRQDQVSGGFWKGGLLFTDHLLFQLPNNLTRKCFKFDGRIVNSPSSEDKGEVFTNNEYHQKENFIFRHYGQIWYCFSFIVIKNKKGCAHCVHIINFKSIFRSELKIFLNGRAWTHYNVKCKWNKLTKYFILSNRSRVYSNSIPTSGIQSLLL